MQLSGTSDVPTASLQPSWNWKRYFSLSIFWLGISLHWAALLSIVIPKQVERFAPVDQRGTWLAVIAGLGAAVSALVQIYVGYMSDHISWRWGKRTPFIAVGTLLSIGALLWMGFANSFASVLLAFLCIQATLNIANGPYQALIPDLVPRNLHGKASMWMGIFQNLGQAVGPIIAGTLITMHYGYLWISVIVSVVLVALMAVTVRTIQEQPANALPQMPRGGMLEAFKVPLRPYPELIQLLMSRGFINMGFYTALDFMLYYVHHSLKVPNYEQATGYLLAMMVAGGLIGGIPAGPLADKFSKVKLIFVANGIAIVSAGLFVMAQTFEQALGIGMILGLGYGAFAVVDWALACNLMPEKGTARYMGVWNLTAVLPQILAPVVAGPITDWMIRSQNVDVAYRGAMAMVIVYLAIGTILLRKLKQ